MQEQEQDLGRAVGTTRTWEFIVAVAFLIVGSVVVWDSRRLGAAWGSDGPEAGYFPFYIGVFIVIASVVNLYSAIAAGIKGREPFVYWAQLRMILIVMIPTVVYVALIANPWMSLGIYVASAIFILCFMLVIGRENFFKAAAISVGVPLALFMMFERWFLVPLPKGPLEAWLGF